MILFTILFIFCSVNADWVAEWMGPVQDQLLFADTIRRNNQFIVSEANPPTTKVPISSANDPLLGYRPATDETVTNFKENLEKTLTNAKVLADSLKTQIVALNTRENLLKEAIANGRLGVTAVTVSTLAQTPRQYIIRDGRWTLCNGNIQYPQTDQSPNLFGKLFIEPQCIGTEEYAPQDPCVFNSVIKYSVVPTKRAPEYTEADYLCLKPAFNNTLERYMSVTQQLIGQTCKNGMIRSLADNTIQCGVRILSEYTFYPHKSSSAALLPLEYCIEKDGSCKLVVAWHVSNATVENFEFLKSDNYFKKYFINNGYLFVEHAL